VDQSGANNLARDKSTVGRLDHSLFNFSANDLAGMRRFLALPVNFLLTTKPGHPGLRMAFSQLQLQNDMRSQSKTFQISERTNVMASTPHWRFAKLRNRC
jgi:hypothetical protein